MLFQEVILVTINLTSGLYAIKLLTSVTRLLLIEIVHIYNETHALWVLTCLSLQCTRAESWKFITMWHMLHLSPGLSSTISILNLSFLRLAG